MYSTAKDFYSISELANEFDISQRAIRFYEEKRLVLPARTEGNQRIYSKRERGRLKLILRGKRFGYSLEEISEMLGMSNTDVDEIDQIETTLKYSDKRLAEIEEDMKELRLLERDLLGFVEKLKVRLAELKRSGKKKGKKT